MPGAIVNLVGSESEVHILSSVAFITDLGNEAPNNPAIVLPFTVRNDPSYRIDGLSF
jgi:hypothetical protein